MITKSNNSHIYIGREAGKEIYEKIKNAKHSVKVVSPYLSASYLKDLINLHKKGIEVTLITCDKIEDSPYSSFKVSDLINKQRVNNPGAEKTKKSILFSMILISGILLISLLFYLLSFSQLFLILSGFSLILEIILIFSYYFISPKTYNYTPIFRIKVFDSHSGKNPRSTELVHSKIFIIDDSVAFLGSANLTYSGFKTHYETAIKIGDTEAVRDISGEVEKLYLSHDLGEKKVEEWGRVGKGKERGGLF